MSTTLATIDATNGNAAGRPFLGNHRKSIVQSQTITIPGSATANDTVQVIKSVPVKAGWLVKGSREKIIVAGAGTATIAFDVGITGATTNGFNAAVNAKATAGTVTQSAPGTDAYATAGGVYITANTTVDILVTIGIGTVTTQPQVIIYLDIEDLN